MSESPRDTIGRIVVTGFALILTAVMSVLITAAYWQSDIKRDRTVIEGLRFKFAEAHMWAQTCEQYRAKRAVPPKVVKVKRTRSMGEVVDSVDALVRSLPCKFDQAAAIARAEGLAGLEPGWMRREVLTGIVPNMVPLEKLSRKKRTIILRALATIPRCEGLKRKP